MNRRGFVRALAAGALLATASAAPVWAQAQDAARFIAQLADQAVTRLTGPGITQAERVNRFRVMFNDGFDVQAIARFAMGRYYNTATPAEQTEYLKLFEDLIVQTYATRFAEYAGESLRLLGTRPGPNGDTIVGSELVRPSGAPVQVQWRVTNVAGAQKVNDIVVEGVSMILIHRDDFAAVIQRGGGKVEALLANLRTKTTQNAATANQPNRNAPPPRR
jgi:phospholipid transport system substrate-binding protein